jgi:Domain of unknown function (DUF4157)
VRIPRWRRSGGEPEHAAALPTAPLADVAAPSVEEHQAEVITASSLGAAPAWATLPALKPSLPAMPLIVSQRFDESLVSWQPPERFIGPLGHSVSPDAPSGVVDGAAAMTVSLPDLAAPTLDPAPQPASSPEPLTLAIPPARSSGPDEAQTWASSRRLDAYPADSPDQVDQPAPVDPGFSAGGETRAEEPLVSTSPAAAEAAPLAGSDQSPESGPDVQADLTGSAPLTPVVQPLVVGPGPQPSDRSFVHAAVPSDMPLAHLPLTFRPDPAPPERAEPLETVRPASVEPDAASASSPAQVGSSSSAPAGPVAESSGLVGDQAMVAPPGAQEPLATTAPSPPDATGPGVELPLAIPERPAPPEESATRRLAQFEDASGAGGPSSETSQADQAPGGDVAPGDAALSAATGPEAATEVEARAAAEPMAPLTGRGSPLVSDGAPGDVGTPEAPTPAQRSPDATPDRPLAVPSRPRAGLGEPMSGLPSTATSWDLTTLSPAEQRLAARALVQREMGRAAAILPIRAQPPGPATGAVRSDPIGGPSAPELVLATTPGPRAAIEDVEPIPVGVYPEDLAPAGPEEAPLLSMDPLVGFPASDQSRPDPAGRHEGARAREVVGQRYGVDLSQVPVNRTPRAAATANQLGARAFTSDAGVVVPPRVGSLDSGPGEALLAHELTHVAQRTRLGAALPSESTRAGQLLEGEAVAVEMTLATGTPPAPPLLNPPGDGAGRSSRVDGDFAAAAQPRTLPLVTPAPSTPDTDALAATILEKMSALSTPATLGGATEVYSSPWSPSPAPAAAAAVGPVQRATDTTPSLDTTTAPPPADGSGSASRPSDEELSNLSRWLYPLIKYRLKGDLREDRERAGLLTNHYGRW